MTKKKTKILPIKVWLDEESCWNNQPQYSEGYVEYVREDYHAQTMLHVLHKGVKQGKKEIFEKAIKWIETNMDDYIHVEYDTITGKPTNEAHIAYKKVVEDFKKAMKEE